MTLPTWADRKGRASLVPLSKLQLLGVVRTAVGGGEDQYTVSLLIIVHTCMSVCARLPFSATERLGSLQGLHGPIT